MIAERINEITATLPKTVALIAVSKTKPVSDLQEAYNAGQRAFGENKVQELVDKYEVLPKDIEWHLIGHLQTNKVKYIAPFVHLIHAVDSLKLLVEINKQAEKNERIIDVLLQFHIAQEETKFGLSLEEAQELIESEAFQSYQHIRVVGVMGMASFVYDEEQVHWRLVAHRGPRQRRRRRLSLVPGTRRRCLQGRGLPDRPERDRELPGQTPRRGQCRRGA